MAGMILSDRQRDILRWYWMEHRTFREIAEWLECSIPTVEREVIILRAVFRSHGHDLPRFNHRRPRTMPVLSDLPAA